MLELLVFRHAKSAWDDADLADHDRPLAPRGTQAATWMGSLMAARGWLPDRILCSSSKRTRATLALAQAQWQPEMGQPEAAPSTLILPGLYLAEPPRLLALLREHGEQARRLMMIGHNPGLQNLVLQLAGTGDAARLAAIRSKFPTAALARLVFDLPDWQDLDWSLGQLVDYERPERRKD